MPKAKPVEKTAEQRRQRILDVLRDHGPQLKTEIGRKIQSCPHLTNDLVTLRDSGAIFYEKDKPIRIIKRGSADTLMVSLWNGSLNINEALASL